MTRPDRWLVLSIRVENPELQALAADALLDSGGASVQEEGGALITYVAPPADLEAFIEEVRINLAETLPQGTGAAVQWRWQADEDWSKTWKAGLAPRRISDRLIVKPTWTEWSAAPGEVVIEVDPQMAFGTGEHATTRGCLRLLDAVVRPGDRVLDVGSGSAILAIAAIRLGAGEAVAVEYDPDANINARENLEQNGVEGRIRLIEAMADPILLAELGSFDVVLANILSGVIRPLLPAFLKSLSPGGRLIVSGILGAEHQDVVEDAEAAGFRVARVDEEEEWWSALLVRGS